MPWHYQCQAATRDDTGRTLFMKWPELIHISGLEFGQAIKLSSDKLFTLIGFAFLI